MATPTVQFTITAQDMASAQLANVNRNLAATATAAQRTGGIMGGTAREGVRKYQSAISSLALSSVGVRGTLGQLAQSVGLLGVGGPVVAAVATGTVLLAAAMNHIKNSAQQTSKTVNDLVTSLLRVKEVAPEVQRATILADNTRIRAQMAALGSGVLTSQGLATGGPAAAGVAAANRTAMTDLRHQLALNTIALRRIVDTPKGGSGRADRPLQQGDRVDVYGLLASMRPGAREAPLRAPEFTVPKIDLIDPQSLNLPVPQAILDALGFQQWAEDMGAAISETFALTVGDAIGNAFAAAFSGEGVGGAIAAFGKTMLAGIGSIFSMMGDQYLKFGLAMKGLAPLLANPFTSAGAAIAIGLLLKALGGALGGIARGGAPGSGGSFRSPGGYGGSFGGGGGLDVFGNGARGPSTVINVQGGPVIDIRDHETRSQLAAAGIEIQYGTRESVQVNHVRRV
jgi:hypothetical protein